MRYNKPVYFQTRFQGEYDETTGDYKVAPVDEVRRDAAVAETGVEALRVVYGTIRQGSLTIVLQQPYTALFDSIRVGEAVYNVDFVKKNKRVFVVSEVQHAVN